MDNIKPWQQIYSVVFLLLGLSCLAILMVNEETNREALPLLLLIPAGIFLWASYSGIVLGKKFSKLHLGLRLLVIVMILGMLASGVYIYLLAMAYGKAFIQY